MSETAFEKCNSEAKMEKMNYSKLPRCSYLHFSSQISWNFVLPFETESDCRKHPHFISHLVRLTRKEHRNAFGASLCFQIFILTRVEVGSSRPRDGCSWAVQSPRVVGAQKELSVA